MIYHNKTKEELIKELKQIQQKHAALLILYATSTVEYRLALDALKASEARYQRLFKTVKDQIFVQSSEAEIIKGVNLFPIDMLDNLKEEFIEKEIWEIGLFKYVAAN